MRRRIILGTNGHRIPSHLVEGRAIRGRFVNDVTYVRSARVSLRLQIWIIRYSGCRGGDLGKKYLGRETILRVHVCTLAVSVAKQRTPFFFPPTWEILLASVAFSRAKIFRTESRTESCTVETNYLLGEFPQITFPANYINYLPRRITIYFSPFKSRFIVRFFSNFFLPWRATPSRDKTYDGR